MCVCERDGSREEECKKEVCVCVSVREREREETVVGVV